MSYHTQIPVTDHKEPVGAYPAKHIATVRDFTVNDDELRSLAEDIVRFCPSLTHLLVHLGDRP